MLRSRQSEEAPPPPRIRAVDPAEAPHAAATAPPESLWESLVADNPVFHKECRSLPIHTRKAARAERWALRLMNLPAYYGLIYLFFLSDTFPDSVTRRLFALGIYAVLLITAGVALTMGVSGATVSIPKERAGQTWDALLLTRLTPQQILLGKLLPHFRHPLEFIAFLTPAVLLCATLGGVPVWSLLLTVALGTVTATLSGVRVIQGSLLQGTSGTARNRLQRWWPALAVYVPMITPLFYVSLALTRQALAPAEMSLSGLSPGLHYAAFAPSLLSPITSFALSLPVWDSVPAVPLALRLGVIALYLIAASGFTWALWRRTLAEFWDMARDSAPPAV